jgi:hypothetical protein
MHGINVAKPIKARCSGKPSQNKCLGHKSGTGGVFYWLEAGILRHPIELPPHTDQTRLRGPNGISGAYFRQG